MSKKTKQHKKNYNLNRKKGNKIILLILALIFVAVPIFTLVIYLIMLNNHAFL